MIASGSPWLTSRLLNAPNSDASAADTTPTAMPTRYAGDTPPVTSATPGTTASPSKSSRGSKRRPATAGSITAWNTGDSAMHVAAIDAFASFTAP